MGAGLAGLSAAYTLERAGMESLLVLEARDRVGGRTLDAPIGRGRVVELGGQWLGPTHTALRALANDLGVETFPTYDRGDAVHVFGGVASRGRFPSLGAGALSDYSQAKEQLDEAAREIPLDRPWQAEWSRLLDRQTVGDWLASHTTTDGARGLFAEITFGALGAAPGDVSLLWFLFYLRSAGGVDSLIATRGGAQDSRFVGGAQTVSLRLARRLGRRVVTRSPVTNISQVDGDAVRIRSRRTRILARRVIVAMMPADQRRIRFTPGLPRARRDLIRHWECSADIKANLIYARPFWRADGLNGQVLTERFFAYDNSPPDASVGVLVVTADRGALPRRRSQRRRVVIETLAEAFGRRARRPQRYLEVDWSEERWSGGCVSPIRPGVLTTAGPALREPVGAVHWAGTETSQVWNGYMEGAVRSGQLAAESVLERL